MPKYEITSPDGKKFEITAPDGATQEQVLSYAQSQFNQPQQEASPADMVSGSRLGRFAAGVAAPVLGAAQLGAHGLDAIAGTQAGPWMDKQLAGYEAAKQRGMKAAGTEGFDVMGLLGSIIPGGVIGSGVSKALPAASSILGKMGAGAVTGGVTAGSMPVQGGEEFSTDKLKQIGGGAVAGGAIPLVAHTLMGAKAAAEPFYQKGQEAIIGRTLRTASGGQADDVANALAQAREIVPGSQPTVGQASGNAGIASLERAASAISPESTVAHQGRAAAQNAARVQALGSVAKDQNAIAAAEAARKAAIAGPHKLLNQSTAQVNPQRTVDLIDDMLEKSSGRSKLTTALKEVKKSLFTEQPQTSGPVTKDAAEKAWDIGAAWKDNGLKSNPAQLYQGARKNITDLLEAKAGDGSKVNESISRELTVILKSLDRDIAQAEPAYKQFLQTFAEKSKPINQMQIGQEIQAKAINPVGQVNLNPLAAALSDKTAQRATGFKRATMEGVMGPDQMATLKGVKDDLIRAVQAQNMAGTAGSDTVKKLAYSNLIDRAGVPTFLREFAPTQVAGNFLARGADTIYGGANRDIAQKLAETLLNPQEAARMMRQVGPSRYQQIIDSLMQQGSGMAGAVAGRNQ